MIPVFGSCVAQMAYRPGLGLGMCAAEPRKGPGQPGAPLTPSNTPRPQWPYCEKRCSYCNFNKYIPRGVDEAAMRSCLVTEAQTLLRLSGVQRVESVFFGGGTPSLASPHTVAAVLEAVAQTAHLPADSEVTLEVNPTSAPASRLAAFGAAGVNRLSIGLQSLDDTELQLLGRTHSASDALQTLAEARRLFPGRVSVDLMLGLPAQQVGPWLRQLEELLRRCDDHVSLYQLSLERGTALFTRVQRGALPAPDPERAAEMYQEGRALLREAGFRQYEVSNFARHHWQQFEPQLTLGDVFGASEEVNRLLDQGLLLLDHRGLRCSWEGLAVLDSLLLTLLPRLQEAWQQKTPSPVPGG
ncbi:Radical S-adenosyl methionine domain-containing protein 1, mitochondrial [Myotis brandtii]|uniref:Radical S-adenosyl methionine domain-containing protein 1, mitochondrial n=1 Tax=Myotis brandtii TaxID=109478 RepID=S7MX07_MYOBR|nr:Radical S-adenosyl methionine domain-containing protein 1, mitochondrial [Myotis brandtii]